LVYVMWVFDSYLWLRAYTGLQYFLYDYKWGMNNFTNNT